MTEPTPRIVIGSSDSIPVILGRLKSAKGKPATVVVTSASGLLLTASEFRALKAAADQSQIQLTIETDDRLRRQLAVMFGLPVIDLLPGAVPEPNGFEAEQAPPS